MIEALAVGARALGVLATAHLIGTSLFLGLAGKAPALTDWNLRLRLTLLPASVLLVVALCAALFAQAANVSGSLAGAPELLRDLAQETAYGRLWMVRTALATLLVVTVWIAMQTPRAIPIVALLAALVATMAAFSGHASGSEDARLLVALHMLHLLALSIWFGGLLPWITLARLAARSSDPEVMRVAAHALHRFSRLAATCMALIVLSGLVLAWTFIEDQGDLLGTRYGALLCAKIALLIGVLRIANRLRTRWLPTLGMQPATYASGARSVAYEWTLALAVLGLGGGLAQTTPAIHDQPRWWLPFRLSLDASAEDPASGNAILIGAGLLTAGLLLFVLTRRGAVSMALALSGSAVALWGLSVTAYPDSFLRAPVPYLTLSIAQGRENFETHCVSCHGAGGLGDGALAHSLAKPPANLSEPHTALHTPGDMYWWFTHGIRDSPMPGFATVLDQEQRWDLVNFLTVFSQGFQARALGAEIAPGSPWLGAPNFYYASANGGRAELKDLRRQRATLLVFDSADDPRSVARLAEARALESAELSVLAPEDPDVWTAYAFLTRTRANRGAPDQVDMPRRHAEFLIDRFGYVRARWIPSDEAQGWDSAFDAKGQASQLAKEPEILPPPDLHLH